MTAKFNLRPPVDSPMVDREGRLTPDWLQFYRQLFNFFENNFTPQIILAPTINNSELSSLPTSPKGAITYNGETDEIICLKAAGWKNVITS